VPPESLAEQSAAETTDPTTDPTDAPDVPGDGVVSDETVRDLPPAGEPTATITPYRDGPLLVRGDFLLVDTDGNEIDPGRKTVALCRCGKSGIKPFCDGTHKRSGFSAGSAPSRPRPAAELFSGTAD
jgi:CDGSH-type Zn-finger protein